MIAPKLRFSEFKGEWNESNVGSLISNSSEKFNPLKETVNLPCVELEHLSQGTGEIIGYCSSVEQKSIKNKFNEKNVLFGKLRPYLKKYAKPDFKGVCSSEIWVLSSQRLNTNFLFQYIQTRAFLDLTLIQSGSKMPRAEWEMVADGTIFYPQEKEQTKIAEFLSAVDDKISQLTRQLELLNQYKKGVMQKIFSQEIRFKNDNGEDFGEWRTCNILEIADVSIGLVTTMTTNYAEIGVPLIRNSDIKQNKIRTSELIYLTPEFANSYENRKLKHKDIVTVHTGDVGVSSVIPQELHGSIGFATINTRVNENEVNPFYLSWFFNSENFINWCVSVSTGDGRQNLNLKDFNNAVIKLPIMKEQEKIAEFLTAIDERIDHTTAQLTHTKQWKKGLLQQMFV